MFCCLNYQNISGWWPLKRIFPAWLLELGRSEHDHTFYNQSLELNNIDCTVRNLTSLQTSIVPKMTCRPSKKLSPMMMTVAPPVVQPSLGLMALMQGVAVLEKDREVRRGKNEWNNIVTCYCCHS